MLSFKTFFQQEMPPPVNMLGDELVNGATWGDLEQVWLKIALDANRHLVRDMMTALWKESGLYPEPFNLERILQATALLAGVDSSTGLGGVPLLPP